MYQQAAWFTTIIFIAGIIGVFVYVLINSRQREEDYAKVKHHGHIIQKFYFIGLLLVLGIATTITLQDLPFDRAKAQENQIEVEAISSQFAFELSQKEFKVGQPIVFNVTSKDVNHGFGIYDENMQIVAQTQAMPEYTNPVYVTFKKPGTYKVLCLEYCGIAHHIMQATITVTE